ncbi:MAG: hypothetical protein HRU69_12575 [Flammeovirgaceae bacterium]|nr:MAG: hypothetical protein HRU69_12575 [Flammeovirgaceae bacterium]
MGSIPISHTETLPVTAKPRIDLNKLFSERPDLLNEACIYIHCHVPVSVQEVLIRIWKSTYLIDQHAPNRAGLTPC